jgi:hypothetical protein
MRPKKNEKRVVRGRQGGRGHKKPLDPNSGPGVSKRDLDAEQANAAAGQIAAQVNQPTEAFRSVDAICRCAELAGWPSRSAFEAAMQMRIHGVPVSEAMSAFMACRKYVQ